MKFIFADSLDYVDPRYDFLSDRNGEGRAPYWDDAYPHEILGYAPYDGVLVSRGIVGDSRPGGKYTSTQAQRFRRVGARKFLRLDKPEFEKLEIFGDCGAFSYVKEHIPPYTPENMVAFYEDGGFTHGCSVDHIIFDFDSSLSGLDGGTPDARFRFDITLDNAKVFLAATRHLSNHFSPLGVIQGWSPGSMAEAARRLCAMGYSYLAVGGMVPLKSPEIKQCLEAIREAVPPETKLHILGFAKADQIASFMPYRITSFDTTSPLIRAFKDARSNYYLRDPSGGLTYYTAIRVPQSIENPKLQRLVKRGRFRPEDLAKLEVRALSALREYDRTPTEIAPVLDAVMEYSAPLVLGLPWKDVTNSSELKLLRQRYLRTLEDRPWTKCTCAICQPASIEVVIFRASNRNKRRGMHNLGVFKGLVDDLEKAEPNERIDFFGDTRSAVA